MWYGRSVPKVRHFALFAVIVAHAACAATSPAPVPVRVGEIKVSPAPVRAGHKAAAAVDVENSGAAPLEFLWETTQGALESAGNRPSVTWNAPDEPGEYEIAVEVRSGNATIARRTATVAVTRGGRLDITQNFLASGWMGDCEKGEPVCTFTDSWSQNPATPPSCIRITYRPNSQGWGGVYFQYGEHNWADQPGMDLRGYRRITFRARAEGNVFAEFKAGGIRPPGKPHPDSFEVSLGTVKVTPQWQQYSIDLSGRDLRNVVGAFAWVARGNANSGGLVLYLDDLAYEE